VTAKPATSTVATGRTSFRKIARTPTSSRSVQADLAAKVAASRKLSGWGGAAQVEGGSFVRSDDGFVCKGISLAQSGYTSVMASYSVNKAAVAHARKLIEAKNWVLDSDWGEVQPSAEEQNAFLAKHSWDEYALWHLGLTDGANDGTKARYAFGYGDLKKIHRTGLIACVYRAAEWRHKKIELAAHRLLQELDKASG
jgi:hypothetical protein